MCGRFSLYAPKELIQETFHVKQLPLFPMRYNIAPSQDILCITSEHGALNASMLHWELIPSWAKDKKIARSLINARAETVAEKPAFRQAFKRHRGLVIMNGFFEWQRENTHKTPYYFKSPDDSLLGVAALWETWRDDNGTEIKSCCLLTTRANALMQPIHDRMPVILTQEQQAIWLHHEPFDKSILTNMLMPCAENTLIRYPVTVKVNNARFEDATAIAPF